MQQVVTNLGLYLVCQFNYNRLGVAPLESWASIFSGEVSMGRKKVLIICFIYFFWDDFNNQFITLYQLAFLSFLYNVCNNSLFLFQQTMVSGTVYLNLRIYDY